VGRNRCPNCGKRVPEYELCCPRCGHSIPIALGGSEAVTAPPFAEGDEWDEEGDDGIDDPELLELAEASVRALPLKELAAIAGTYKYTPAPDFTKFRPHTNGAENAARDEEAAADDDAEGDSDADADADQGTAPAVDAVDDYEVAEEISEPVTIGAECPACGRQAQKGWKTCPWCGTILPA
jgi:hypothetical protein